MFIFRKYGELFKEIRILKAERKKLLKSLNSLNRDISKLKKESLVLAKEKERLINEIKDKSI